MPHKQLRYGKGFRVAMSNRRAQAATMVIAPGDAEGGPDNRHLKTLNVYVPPAYRSDGEELPRGRK